MGKKKPTGGKHKTDRVNVGFPEPWHAIARKIAAKRQQPVLYALISLLMTEAEKQGVSDLPPPPWEADSSPE